MDIDMIPIDIQCNKLVDWLIDRRHCSVKWQTAAQGVKNKISSALLDMPSTEEMKRLLQGSCFHYFKCLKIVDVLKETEKDSKNIFGMYSSRRMKDWKEILKLYEKDNLHIAELSSRMLRNVNYEIPAIKRQIAKCIQVQNECQKSIQDCDRSILLVEKHYAEECKKVGVEGKDVRKELLVLVEKLPGDFAAIGKKFKHLLPIIEYYIAFVEYSISSNEFANSITPLVKHLSAHGNTTVYQWKHGVVPDKVIKQEKVESEKITDVQNPEKIDWGEVGQDCLPTDDVIDFDIDLQETNTTDDVIDVDVSDLGIEVETSGDNENQENDNGYEVVAVKEKWQIEEVSVSEVPNGGKLSHDEVVATGDEALTVLEYVTTRTQVINELIELSAFLTQRLAEVQSETDSMSLGQFQSAPPILQLTSMSELQSMTAQVSSIYDDLISTKMQQLCRILDSPNYVDRIVDKLQRQHALTNKYEKQKRAHESTIKSLRSEEKSLYPKVDFLAAETKEWQVLIQEEISKRYKNRPVYILGSINLL